MTTSAAHEVTRILQAVGGNRAQAAEDLLPVVYEQLRAIAQFLNNRHCVHPVDCGESAPRSTGPAMEPREGHMGNVG